MNDAKQCPWCSRWCLKDDACNYIFACGLELNGKFIIGAGCGRSWCWKCEKKFCSVYYDHKSGLRVPEARDFHDSHCCPREPGYKKEDYCSGGHNSHCEPR